MRLTISADEMRSWVQEYLDENFSKFSGGSTVVRVSSQENGDFEICLEERPTEDVKEKNDAR